MLKFHGSSFLVAFSQHLRDILARISLTCHEKIGRVRRVGEDVTKMLRECYEETAAVEFQHYKT